MTGDGIPSWETSQAKVCERIKSTHATLKILLKTKNEHDLLGRWIEHHAAIVGLEGLIIFDNDSSDAVVLATLDSIRDRAVVTKFSGFHNYFHRLGLFGALYAAVQSSCDYFVVLDTDEFLIWIDQGGELVAASNIVDRIRALPRQEVILGAWAENHPGLQNRFDLFKGVRMYPAGLASGKSILSSAVDLSGTICHNWQLKGPATGNARYGNALVLHMKHLLPEQRLSTNMEKLRQYGFLSAEDGVEKVLRTRMEDVPPSNIRKYVREIKQLQAMTQLDEVAAPLQPGQIELDDSGRLEFHSADDRAKWLAYLQAPGAALREALADRVSSQRLFGEKRKAWLAGITRGAVEADSAEAKITVRQFPSMPPAGIEFLREKLSSCRCFLEYGSGGSTRMAVHMKVPHVYSVESDPAFARAVEREIRKEGKETRFRMVSVNIGDTANNWGKPRNKDRCQSWPKYPTRVWSGLRKAGLTPDLILIDGRFRVACFLACLIQAEPGTTVLFDDYVGREKQYQSVEKYLRPIELVGRMAVFRIPPNVDLGALAFDLAHYAMDFR